MRGKGVCPRRRHEFVGIALPESGLPANFIGCKTPGQDPGAIFLDHAVGAQQGRRAHVGKRFGTDLFQRVRIAFGYAAGGHFGPHVRRVLCDFARGLECKRRLFRLMLRKMGQSLVHAIECREIGFLVQWQTARNDGGMVDPLAQRIRACQCVLSAHGPTEE